MNKTNKMIMATIGLIAFSSTAFAARATTGMINFVQVESKNNIQSLQIQFKNSPKFCTEKGVRCPDGSVANFRGLVEFRDV